VAVNVFPIVLVEVGVAVRVAVLVEVRVGLFVGVKVAVELFAGLLVGVEVEVRVGLFVAVLVGVWVGELAEVFEGVAVKDGVGVRVAEFVGVFVAVRVKVLVGGTGVGVLVIVRVGVLVGIGVPPGGQVGWGVAMKVETAAPQVEVPHVQLERRFGQELGVMDQAVPPRIPEVPFNQANILVSKVESSVLQLVEGPYSPTKTG